MNRWLTLAFSSSICIWKMMILLSFFYFAKKMSDYYYYYMENDVYKGLRLKFSTNHVGLIFRTSWVFLNSLTGRLSNNTTIKQSTWLNCLSARHIPIFCAINHRPESKQLKTVTIDYMQIFYPLASENLF